MSKDAPFGCSSARIFFLFFFAILFTLSLCGKSLAAGYQDHQNYQGHQGPQTTNDYRTANFIIRGVSSAALARHFGETAETLRHDLAILWLGEPLPQWSAPCPIHFRVGKLGAGGETSFTFSNDTPFSGEVFGWEMKIQGSVEALTTAVLPHEITHMIFASYFRCPLPRWFDEGGATSVEDDGERMNYRRQLYQFLRTDRGIPFNDMVRMTKYPNDVMPFYAQGFSVVEYLIAKRGHHQFIRFAGDGLVSKDWGAAVRKNYGFKNLGELQVSWNDWVIAGCPPLQPDTGDDIGTDIAGNTTGTDTVLVAGNTTRSDIAHSDTIPVQQVSYIDEIPQPILAAPLPKIGENPKIGEKVEPAAVIAPSRLSSTPFAPPLQPGSHISAHPGLQDNPLRENRVLLEWKRL